MQRHQDSVLIQNTLGQTVVGSALTVLVYNAGTLVLATIYSDNGVTLINQGVTPITTDINGSFEFYAANGRYDVTISGAAITTIQVPDIFLEDLSQFFGGNYADNTGSVNAILVNYPNATSSVITDGFPIEVDTSTLGTNTTSVTIQPTILGVVQAVKAVNKYNGINTLVALVAGDMPQVAQLRWNAANLVWVLINPQEGEYITSTVVSTAVALTTATPTTVTSITLPVGDWDITGSVVFAPAATTSVTAWVAGSNTATNTLPVIAFYAADFVAALVIPTVIVSKVIPARRVKAIVPTIVYLIADAAFTVSTMTAGGTINARRVAQ